MCLCGGMLDENDVVWTLATDKTTGRYVLSSMCALFSTDVSSQVVFCCCCLAKLYLIFFLVSFFVYLYGVWLSSHKKKDYKVYLKHVWRCLWHVMVNGKKNCFFLSSGWCCVIAFLLCFIFSFLYPSFFLSLSLVVRVCTFSFCLFFSYSFVVANFHSVLRV